MTAPDTSRRGGELTLTRRGRGRALLGLAGALAFASAPAACNSASPDPSNSFTPSGTAAAEGPSRPSTLSTSCWGGEAECDPFDTGACATGSVCDVTLPADGEPLLRCLPTVSPRGLGEACDVERGPFCGPALRCAGDDRRCAPTCCTDADCPTGLSCVALDPSWGSLGGCVGPPVVALTCADCAETEANSGACQELRAAFCPQFSSCAKIDSCVHDLLNGCSPSASSLRS